MNKPEFSTLPNGAIVGGALHVPGSLQEKLRLTGMKRTSKDWLADLEATFASFPMIQD